MPGVTAWLSVRDKRCTYCGTGLEPHACNCCSCPKKGHRIAWRCGTTCNTRSKSYGDRLLTGDAASTAWAAHRNHGVFCSKKCHDADASRARANAEELKREYQWLKQGRSLVVAAKASRTKASIKVPPASPSPSAESPPRRTFGI